MNCLDVRRHLDSDPANKTDALASHLSSCAACSEYAQHIEKSEKKLLSALTTDVPDGLAYRILLAKDIHVQQKNKQSRLRLYSIAASLLLTVGLVSTLLFVNHPYSLQQVALQHIQDELRHLSDRKNVQLSTLNNVLSPFSVKFNNMIGTINYAGACNIRNNRGVHIVLQGKTEPVTLLIMPGEYVKQRQHINGKQFKGVIVPVKNGSIALIGRSASEIDTLEKTLQRSLQFI